MNNCIIIFHYIFFFSIITGYCIFTYKYCSFTWTDMINIVFVQFLVLIHSAKRKSYIAHLETMKFFLLVFWIILLCILRYINFCRFIIPSTSTWNHFYKGITPQNYKKCLHNNILQSTHSINCLEQLWEQLKPQLKCEIIDC